MRYAKCPGQCWELADPSHTAASLSSSDGGGPSSSFIHAKKTSQAGLSKRWQPIHHRGTGYPRLFNSPAFSFLPPTLPSASASPRAGDQQWPPQSGGPSGDPPRQGSRADTSSVPISQMGKLRLGERKWLAQGHIFTPVHLENKD